MGNPFDDNFRDDFATRQWRHRHRATLALSLAEMPPRFLAEATTFCETIDNLFAKELAARAGRLEKYLDARTKKSRLAVVMDSARSFGIAMV